MPFWILWVNKRYLKYIKPLNPKKDIKLADSKLRTKRLLENLDIPHPKLLDVIKNRKQLHKYDFSKLYGQDFVIKPNKWSKWKWIMICKVIEIWRKSEEVGRNDNTEESWFFVNPFSDDKKKILIKANWEFMTQKEFKKHLVDILDWKYSLTLWNDIILIEEKVQPSDEFKSFCEYWLADIRVITMNLIPVMAMLRYPTIQSKWKANIAAWWIGFGIDIWTWKITSMYCKKKIYIKEFPEEYKNFYWQQIPYWDDILLYSSQIQYFTNIWYLWSDWVIARNWPSLLEINARAGMEIQLVNGEWLEKRLRKIEDLKVPTPSKWVEIWKTLFSKKQTNPTVKKDVIYLEQPGILKKVNSEKWIVKNKEITKSQNHKITNNQSPKSPSNPQISEIPITIKVDLDHKVNYADPKIIEDFEKTYTIKFNNIILDNVKFNPKENLKNTITLWTKLLDNFIIIPKKKDIRNFSIWNKDSYLDSEEVALVEIDNLINQLSKKLNISRIVKPKNYMEELDNFITWNWNYNPKFEYKYPTDRKLQQIEDDLKQIKEKFFNIKSEYKSDLFQLFKEKFIELEYKLELIKAYKKQDFRKIWKYNKLLFGKINYELVEQAKIKVNTFNQQFDLWRSLFTFEISERIKQHLKKRNIEAKIIFEPNLSSRVLVRRWEPLTIVISKNSTFYEKEFDMILAHEIDVHVVRYLNWKKTWWKILQAWTAFYLKDEEWLAIWNSLNYLPENYEKNSMYEKYILVSIAEQNDFVHLSNIIRSLHHKEWLLKIFRRTIRFKRWIQNTAFTGEWTAYYKDKIYLDGYEKIRKWIKEGGSFKNMLKWKYKIEDLKFINTNC